MKKISWLEVFEGLVFVLCVPFLLSPKSIFSFLVLFLMATSFGILALRHIAANNPMHPARKVAKFMLITQVGFVLVLLMASVLLPATIYLNWNGRD